MKSKDSKVISILLIVVFLLSSCVTPNRTILISASSDSAQIYVNNENIGIGSGQYTVIEGETSLNLRASLPDYYESESSLGPKPGLYSSNDLMTAEEKKKNTISWVLGAGSIGIAGLIFGFVEVIGSAIAENDTNYPVAIGSLAVGLTGSYLAVNVPLTFSNIKNKTTWPEKYIIDMEPHNHYDYAGFHKETGYNRIGHNRNGDYLNGNSFSGKIVNGDPSGAGVFFNAESGEKSIGIFHKGLLTGPGIKILDDGQKYYSIYESGLETDITVIINGNSKRRVLYIDGKITEELGKVPVVLSKYPLIYLGREVDSTGRANGVGTSMSEDGMIVMLDGEFQSGRIIKGQLHLPDGTVFAGSFSNDILTEGDLYYSNGNHYSGSYRNGIPHGEGTMNFYNGDFYEGSFNNNVINGSGTYSFRDGSKYIGEYDNGVMNGTGSFFFNNGGSYTGAFLNGTFFGVGVLVQANGETFEGPFKDGLPHGEGIYKFGNQVEKAEYYEGKRIDQAYIIRMDREAEKQAELARQELEQKQREEEAKRIAAQQKKDEEARKKAESNRMLGGFLGGMTAGIVGHSIGLDDSAVLSLAESVTKDIYSGDTSLSNTQSTISTITRNMNNENENKSSFANYQIKPQVVIGQQKGVQSNGGKTDQANVQPATQGISTSDSDVSRMGTNLNDNDGQTTIGRGRAKYNIVTKTFSVNFNASMFNGGSTENNAIESAKYNAMENLEKEIHKQGYVLAPSTYMKVENVILSGIETKYHDKNEILEPYWTASVTAAWTGEVRLKSEDSENGQTVQSN